MLSRLFKKKKINESKSFIGCRTKLIHDVTVFQTGVIIIDGIRLSVKTIDETELCKGTLVEVVKEEPPYTYVKKV